MLDTDAVHRHVRAFLDSRIPGAPVRIVSIAAGRGQELLPVVAAHARRADVRARLVERDPNDVADACESIGDLRLDWNVDVVCADPSLTDSYSGAVPADLVLLDGIFAFLGPFEIRHTIELLPELCAERAFVLWNSGPRNAADVRSWFGQSSFLEEAFDSSSGVGVERFVGVPRTLRTGVRLFASPIGARNGTAP